MESVGDSEYTGDWKKQASDSISKAVSEDNTDHLEETLHVIIDKLGHELDPVVARRDAGRARSLLDIPKGMLVHLHLRQSSLTKVREFRYWDYVSALLSVTLDLRLLLMHVNDSRKELRRAVFCLCFHLTWNRHQVWDAIVQSLSVKKKCLTQYLPEMIEMLLEWCPSTCSDPTQYLKFVVTVASVSRCKKVDEDGKKALKKALSAIDPSFDFREWFLSQSFRDLVPATCTSQKKLIKFLFKGEITRHQLHSLCDSVSTVFRTDVDSWRGDEDVFFIDKRTAERVSEQSNELEESLKRLEVPEDGRHAMVDDDVDSETVSSSSEFAEDTVTFLESYLSRASNTGEGTKDASLNDDHEYGTRPASEMLNAETPQKKRSRRKSSGSYICERSDAKHTRIQSSDEAIDLELHEPAVVQESTVLHEIQLSPCKPRAESIAPVQPQTNEMSNFKGDTSSAKIKVNCVDLDECISDVDTVAAGEEVQEIELSSGEIEPAVGSVTVQSSSKRGSTAEVTRDKESFETESLLRSDEPDGTFNVKSRTEEHQQNYLPVLTVVGEPHEKARDEAVQGRVRCFSVAPLESTVSEEAVGENRELNCERDTPPLSAVPKTEILSQRKARLAMHKSMDESEESVKSCSESTHSDPTGSQSRKTLELPCRETFNSAEEVGDDVKRKTTSEQDVGWKDVATQTPSPRKRKTSYHDSHHDIADDSDHDALLLDVDNHDILKLKPPPLSPENAVGASPEASQSKTMSQASTQPCMASESQNHFLAASTGTSASSGSGTAQRTADPAAQEAHIDEKSTPTSSNVGASEQDESLGGLTQICAVLSDGVDRGDKSSPQTDSQTKQTPTTVRARSTRRSAVTAREKIAESCGTRNRPRGGTETDRTVLTERPKENPRYIENGTPMVAKDLQIPARKSRNETAETERGPRRRTSSRVSDENGADGENRTSETPAPCKVARVSLGRVEDLFTMVGMTSTPCPTTATKQTLRSTHSEGRVAPVSKNPSAGLGEGKADERCDASSHRLFASFCTSCLSVVEVTPTSDVATMTESLVEDRKSLPTKKASAHTELEGAMTPRATRQTRSSERSTRTRSARYSLRQKKLLV